MSNDEIDTACLCGSQWRSQKGGCDVSWTVIEADGNGVRETRSGGTLTGETEPEPEPEPEPKPKPKMVTWRRCVRIEPTEIYCGALWVKWHPSENIPEHWYPIEAQSQPIETVQQLPEGQEPRVKANMVFTSLCGWTKADGNGVRETCIGGQDPPPIDNRTTLRQQ
jgi:hypothetical protein